MKPSPKYQPELFKKEALVFEGKRLGEEGLERAVRKAEKDNPGWKEKCWELFKRWIDKKPMGYEFLMEEFRQDVEKWKMIEKPNSSRAYGVISKRALREKLIEGAGMGRVSNATAHNCFAAKWKKL